MRVFKLPKEHTHQELTRLDVGLVTQSVVLFTLGKRCIPGFHGYRGFDLMYNPFKQSSKWRLRARGGAVLSCSEAMKYDHKENARLISFQILLNALDELLMTDPKTRAKRRREFYAIRERLSTKQDD